MSFESIVVEPGGCLFCGITDCRTRVLTRDLSFDEVACDKHLHELNAVVRSLPAGTKVLVYECLTPIKRGERMDDAFDVLEDAETA